MRRLPEPLLSGIRFRRSCLAASSVLALVLVSGCGDYGPFAREASLAEIRLLAPSAMSPVIAVASNVEGAPADWRIGQKVAQSLLARDVLASTAPPGRSTYVLRGALRRVDDGGISTRYDVSWELFDPAGLSVGRVTHMALMERNSRSGRADFAESLAEVAAIKVAQLVNNYTARSNSGAVARNAAGQSAEFTSPDGRARSRASDSADDDMIEPGKPLSRPPQLAPPQSERPSRREQAESAEAAKRPAARPDSAPPPVRLAENKPATAPGNGQHWLQVGSHKDEATGLANWEKLRGQSGNLLSAAHYRIVRADLGPKGIYYRLQVGPFASAGEAMQLCQQLKARSFDCFLAPTTGVAVVPKIDTPPAEKPNTVAKTAPAPKTPPVKAPEANKPAGRADVLGPPSGSDASAKPPAKEAPTNTTPGLPGVLD